MSFQGDVGGIGLAELLQSLARGRREGVLTLSSQEGEVCTLGLETGVLYLLPEPGEDASIWKERARQAWVHQPDFRVDALRTAEIARAHRIERLFELLDSEGVHFRFDPRSLPGRAEGPLELTSVEAAQVRKPAAGAPRLPQVYCEGVSVEYLLLEYARLNDELASFGGSLDFSDHDVPRWLAPGADAEAARGFPQECDGASSVAEIADRLACPIRQCRLLAADGCRQRRLRFASAGELLALAEAELAEGHVQRASSRLSAWVRACPPGPIDRQSALLLDAEWQAERLAPVLNRMRPALVRALVRRIDHALGDPSRALHHWRELQRMRRHDGIVELHRIACECRAESAEEDGPSLRELLEVSRGFRELGRPRRAAAILRIAAARKPTSNSARLDIGIGLVAAGMIEEGAPWILDTAKALLAAGAPEKAIAPLRTLLEAAPGIREGRRLLLRARNLAVRRNIIRKHSAIGIAVVVALALGAWVQIRVERRIERQFEEVAGRLTDPIEAQELFDRYFNENDSEHIVVLGATIRERRRELESALRTEWYESFREAQLECSFGEVVVGLERALAIPNPPVLVTVTEPWPLVSDLFNGLAARLESALRDLGEPQLDAPQQVHAEAELAESIQALSAMLDERGRPGSTDAFRARIEALATELSGRAEARGTNSAERDRLDLLTRQELLLEAAQAHAKAGDLERSLVVFDRLLANDPSGRLADILREEIDRVRARFGAVEEARRLASEGRHAEASAMLEEHLERPGSEPLPWKLETFPPGALAYMPDGSVRKTPFEIESRIGEHLEIRVELEGTLRKSVSLDAPADQFLWLTRIAERNWSTDGRIEALPVAVGLDHIVCDRAGRVARLSNSARPRWERQLGSLGGVGRSPVFLSRRAGFLLAVTEDGEAWIVDSKGGDLEGPWELGSPPWQGPSPTAEGATVTLRDGRIVTWNQRLKPIEVESSPPPADVIEDAVPSARTFTAGLAVLRSPSGGEQRLDSPWNDWTAEIRDEVFLVSLRGNPAAGFAAERVGEWSYIAWEAPHGMLPNGRLWISDGAGLRSYLP